ncbi:alanine racemase [Ensifer adhaerens]|uniref:alanine racemase n=1 Tax=Ensifer adhaerens TaxID=106592 RepID=UPI001CBFACE5|nr:alanine racemase [Ensifer adhaerens]MBZ7925947.1 alanine racemase [Ensifer adhaerens]UAX94899.1 alanine racemase [Ensifer adhaerens]UAY03210.1 alanine racemase [Ensifer adhaerens]UAY11195.1 alanine racemase [Ensifer adhaerens]
MDGTIQAKRQHAATATGGASGYLTIDLAAIARNYEKLAAEVAPARAAAVVKADAYGLGAVRVAARLYEHGCRHFFVAHFVEALRLQPTLAADAIIYVLNGLQPGNETACAERGIVPIINSLEQLQRWSHTARTLGRKLPAALQFDTGMSRLGIPPAERAAVASLLGDYIDVRFIMSHLASADEAASEQNGSQLAEMSRITAEFPEFDLCFANSGGIFLGRPYHGVLARPGIALYGGAPIANQPNPMAPVLRLDVAVVQTRTVPAGARVGYSGTHIAAGETRLATIAAGYADGLPRCLSDRGAVYCDGVRLPIVGRVSMDSITVDISALPEGRLHLGSLVEVLGPHQTLEDIARDAGTIAYEILTGLGQRYERQYR